MGGDFNEPSHLDWLDNTKNLFDHNGAVIHWDCSMMLSQAGFKDAYREKYPDPVLYPGFTFPAGNRVAEKPNWKSWLGLQMWMSETELISFIIIHNRI